MEVRAAKLKQLLQREPSQNGNCSATDSDRPKLPTRSLLTKVALLVVRVHLVAKCIHVLFGITEALLVHVSALTAASPMPALCVCWLWQANNWEDRIGGMTEASLVHG